MTKMNDKPAQGQDSDEVQPRSIEDCCALLECLDYPLHASFLREATKADARLAAIVRGLGVAIVRNDEPMLVGLAELAAEVAQ